MEKKSVNLKKLQVMDFVTMKQIFFGAILMMVIAVEILLILEIVYNVHVLVSEFIISLISTR